MKPKFVALSVAIAAMIVLGGCEQSRRDGLRYDALKRGYEKYKMPGDSQAAAGAAADKAIVMYERRLAAYGRYLQGKSTLPSASDRFMTMAADLVAAVEDSERKCAPAEVAKGNKESPACTSAKQIVEQKKNALDEAEQEALTRAKGEGPPMQTKAIGAPPLGGGASPGGGASQIELFWPSKVLDAIRETKDETEFDDKENKKKTTNTTGPDDEMIRALSSTASIAQMRDLITEPSFPSMLPIKRKVDLGCLPPPDSAAFEASLKLEAAVERAKTKVGVDVEYASKVVQLFEESERTLFLQYALFRLCELSINAPAEFRNVYPVVIHDIVRRTAEMRETAAKEAEIRKGKEAEARKAALELEGQKAVVEAKALLEKQTLYGKCIDRESKKANADSTVYVPACKKEAGLDASSG